jgi:hypothetical protein
METFLSFKKLPSTTLQTSELTIDRETADEYLEAVVNRLVVEFRQLDSNGKYDAKTLPPFFLELSKKMKYSQVAEQIAVKYNTDPLHLRFTNATKYAFD